MERAEVRRTINRAVWHAAPMFVTAGLALAGAADLLRLPTGSAPVRMGVVVLALAIGVAITSALDRSSPRSYWQMGLLTTLILLPTAALLASASRVPFIAISRGSAGPLLWLTLATVAVMFGLWLFAAFQTEDAPENASLLFLPPALLVPAMLGAPGAVEESASLAMLGQANLLAGVAIMVGMITPERRRPLAGALALGVQFVVLWMIGRGPVLGEDGGFVVPASAAVLLALTVLLTVMAPLGALFSRRFFQTVEEESGARRATSAPPRGARQRNRF